MVISEISHISVKLVYQKLQINGADSEITQQKMGIINE